VDCGIVLRRNAERIGGRKDMNRQRSDFYEWQQSLRWDEAKNAYRAADGSLWELENEDEQIYAEVAESPSEQEIQSKLEAGW
jgi:hypothetical protein